MIEQFDGTKISGVTLYESDGETEIRSISQTELNANFRKMVEHPKPMLLIPGRPAQAQPADTDPCPCGSGGQYGGCHGRYLAPRPRIAGVPFSA